MKDWFLSIVRIKIVQNTIILLLRILPWRKRRIRKYLKDTDKPRLQIGCSKNVLKGWLNTDISLRCVHGIYLDAGKPFPFKDASFNYVFPSICLST